MFHPLFSEKLIPVLKLLIKGFFQSLAGGLYFVVQTGHFLQIPLIFLIIQAKTFFEMGVYLVSHKEGSFKLLST